MRPMVAVLSLSIAVCAASLAKAASTPQTVVFFTPWSALVDDAAGQAISTAAQQAKASAGASVVVTGYADTTGSAAANRLLSMTRAQVVVDALEADGVAATRIRRKAAGRTPAVNTTLESRRVTIAIGGN